MAVSFSPVCLSNAPIKQHGAVNKIITLNHIRLHSGGGGEWSPEWMILRVSGVSTAAGVMVRLTVGDDGVVTGQVWVGQIQ